MGRRQPFLLVAVLAMAACNSPASSAPTATSGPSSTSSPSALTGDCDGLAIGLCQAAVSEAQSFGLFLQPGETVVRWRARPAAGGEWPGCGNRVAAVTFEIAPSGEAAVTIGQLPSGRLAVCTY